MSDHSLPLAQRELTVQGIGIAAALRWRALGAVIALTGAVVAVLIVHLPVLDHYFFADDFLPLGEMARRGTWPYLGDLFLVRDITPNWRFLTGVFYLGEYRAFGLNAFPFVLTSVLFYLGTVGLVFVFVARAKGKVWPASLAGAFFGLTAAHVPTVGHITAFTHVLAGFFFMLSLIMLYEGLERRQLRWWAASVIPYLVAIAANEGMAMLAPVPALLVLWKLPDGAAWWRQRRQWTRVVAMAAPYAVIGSAALITFAACGCTAAAEDDMFASGGHLIDNLWIYLGRLLYPVGMEAPGDPGTAHLVAGIVAAAIAVGALLRGSALARFSVLFLLLALVPYLPMNWALAPRYVYTAAIPFSILTALIFAESARLGARLSSAAPAAVVLLAFGVLGVQSWQTWVQNEAFDAETEHWRVLVTDLREQLPDPPPGSRVIVRGGPLAIPFIQGTLITSVARVVWVDDIELYVGPTWLIRACTPPNRELYVLAYADDHYAPVPVGDVVRPRPPPEGFVLPAVTAVDCPPGTSPIAPPP